jgi:polyferredoxin
LATFSTVLLTSPLVTAIVLAGMLIAAVGLSLVFERRAFCRYVCPVGGFIGLYSQVAPIELRIKNKAVCAACNGKPCYNGSAAGYGCPWDVFPAGLSKNTYCGLCMECLRTCPHENISLNLRPFAADLRQPGARLDEAFKGFVMLGSAMAYSAVLLGPWGFLKEAAYRIGSAAWFGYVLGVLAIIGLVLPGLFALCVARALRPPVQQPHSAGAYCLDRVQPVLRHEQRDLCRRLDF